MFIVSVILVSIQDGDIQEKTFEATSYADACTCKEYWEKHEDVLYVDLLSVNEVIPSIEEALLGA